MLCGGRENRLEQIVGARVHRLSAADYLIRAELGEQLAQTLTGRDRNIAERLRRLDRLHRLGLILGRLNVARELACEMRLVKVNERIRTILSLAGASRLDGLFVEEDTL